MSAEEGGVERQPSEREAMLRSYVMPRALNLCEYLDREGIQRIADGHRVGEKIRIPLMDPKMDLWITMDVRKADA